MVTPKYEIGETVFVYESGKIIEKVVCKIQLNVSEDKTKIGYQFKTEDKFREMLFHNNFTDESEVFESREEFHLTIH